MKTSLKLFLTFLCGSILLNLPLPSNLAQIHFQPATRAGAAGASLTAASSAVISIWGGARDTIALRSDGSVWTWGINDCVLGSGNCGKLGDGTTLERHLPTRVHGPGNVGFLDSISAIMAGEHTNYALKSDGTLWAWGGNFAGQLGDGTYINSVTPVQVSGLSSVKSLGGRGYHTLAVKTDGTVWAWGWNKYGELGHDTSGSPCLYGIPGTCSNVPLLVSGVNNPLMVTGGGFFNLALMPDHSLLGWGRNNHGELGDGTFTERPAPVPVNSVLANVEYVSAGWFHAVALTTDKKVWTWGNNTSGEIGTGSTSTTGVNLPVQVPGLANVKTVSAGDGFTAALKADGTVWTWGGNAFGQLGDGTFTDRPSPAQVAGLENVVYLAARDYHVIVIKADGSVWCWGSNENGECGDNTVTDRTRPVQTLFLDQSLFLPLITR